MKKNRGQWTWRSAFRLLAVGIALSGCEAETTTLVAAVERVDVMPRSGSVQVGSTMQLSVQVMGATAALTGRTVNWSSSNTERATVNAEGVVTGVSAGTVSITAMSEGQTGTAAISVLPPPVASVTLSPSPGSVAVGATLQLTATLRDAGGNVLTDRTLAWSASNARATVDGTGLVSGLSTGAVTITATSEGRTGTAAITVTPPPVASVTVSPATASVTVGETLQLTATLRDAAGNVLTGRTVDWSSSDQARLSVSAAGEVTGVSEGSATITAGSERAVGSTSVTVVPAPEAPSIQTTTLPAGTVGWTYDATVEASGGEAPYAWAVSSGSLPPGLALSDAGTLGGTPALAGVFPFTVQATGSNGLSSKRPFTIEITGEAPRITSTFLAPGTVGEAYLAGLQASGGQRPYSWSVVTGALPPGLLLASNGVISGVPTTTGSFGFGIQVTGADGPSTNRPFTVSIEEPRLFFLDANGVTVRCPAAQVGSSGLVNGILYAKRTRDQINRHNAASTCTSGITDMSGLFANAPSVPASISSWDVSSVVNMAAMFRDAPMFNAPIGIWDVSNVTDMTGMFDGAWNFN